jgi:hypothetical protein
MPFAVAPKSRTINWFDPFRMKISATLIGLSRHLADLSKSIVTPLIPAPSVRAKDGAFDIVGPAAIRSRSRSTRKTTFYQISLLLSNGKLRHGCALSTLQAKAAGIP